MAGLMGMVMNMGAALLRRLPPETAHRATIHLLNAAAPLLPRAAAAPSNLVQTLWGKRFANPVGLAAGFDKDGEVPDAMLKLGFGFVECGTVTPRPQAGNPRPRLFRLAEDRAVINRMGFNNAGMTVMEARLGARKRNGIVGINIGANKDTADRANDYRDAFARLAPYADYITVNVSSPNTPGLRGLQNPDELKRLLDILTNARTKRGHDLPLLLKIAPDIDAAAIGGIAEVALEAGIEGIIATNTTIARPASLQSPFARESGGLSGAPLLAPSTGVLRALRAHVGTRMILVGAGGVASGADAYAKIRAGANLVQLYTALAWRGPALVTQITRELSQLIARDGYKNIADAVGTDAR
ncbi:MAG TPA: quinone-dependent dihydroorotate dehydrogenase [Rhizomicrobium sp.]|nr:quinone-dependent dihydroorotate dehydrogenase [Rhizomicrobium sp.]